MSQIVLDIETFAHEDAAQFIEEPSAPANYKDPEKIKAYIEDAKAKAISRCALDLDLCRIVAIGTYSPITGSAVACFASEQEEAEGLAELGKRLAKTSQIIGFNIFGFDLPVLIRRAQYLGVEFPGFNIDRYRSPHLDLMQFLSFGDKQKTRGLSFYAKRFGIDVDDDSTGADIDALVRAGDWAGVAAHCSADVEKTRRLAERLHLLMAVEVF